MKDIGILYTDENRLAVIEDRKWMTRRIPASFKEINKKPDEWVFRNIEDDEWVRSTAYFSPKNSNNPDDFIGLKLPYAVGDMLYIKEPHYLYGHWEPSQLPGALMPYKWRFIRLATTGVLFPDTIDVRPVCHDKTEGFGWFKRSPLFMPKDCARHWQRVTGVKVERLQSITPEDCIAEGIRFDGTWWRGGPHPVKGGTKVFATAVLAYADLWDSIHGPGVWELNPWLVAVTFKRLAERREK